MTDQLRERIENVVAHRIPLGLIDHPEMRGVVQSVAAAVLADLREAGELRTLEQVGFLRADRSMFVSASGPLRGTNPPDGWVSVYIMREDTDG